MITYPIFVAIDLSECGKIAPKIVLALSHKLANLPYKDENCSEQSVATLQV